MLPCRVGGAGVSAAAAGGCGSARAAAMEQPADTEGRLDALPMSPANVKGGEELLQFPEQFLSSNSCYISSGPLPLLKAVSLHKETPGRQPSCL